MPEAAQACARLQRQQECFSACRCSLDHACPACGVHNRNTAATAAQCTRTASRPTSVPNAVLLHWQLGPSRSMLRQGITMRFWLPGCLWGPQVGQGHTGSWQNRTAPRTLYGLMPHRLGVPHAIRCPAPLPPLRISAFNAVCAMRTAHCTCSPATACCRRSQASSTSSIFTQIGVSTMSGITLQTCGRGMCVLQCSYVQCAVNIVAAAAAFRVAAACASCQPGVCCRMQTVGVSHSCLQSPPAQCTFGRTCRNSSTTRAAVHLQSVVFLFLLSV